MWRIGIYACFPSLPSRERGLKFQNDHLFHFRFPVAPFAGAWIEIFRCFSDAPVFLSLPSRERGLKWVDILPVVKLLPSLPSRERGLKFDIVKPFLMFHVSLPSRERGLKSWLTIHESYDAESLPSRERGLKLGDYNNDMNIIDVAPFAGAWIEIFICLTAASIRSRSLRGSVD